MSEAKQRDLMDYLQWLFTLVIAVGGIYLNWQQGKLQEAQHALEKAQAEIDVRSKRERMIQLFADKTFTYVEQMGLDKADKNEVLIELVDIITEINVSESGKVDEANYKTQKSLIPLRLALVTGDHEILAHITRSTEKQALWVAFAEKSNNDLVRNTAIRALGQIYRHADDSIHDAQNDVQRPDYHYAIRKVMSISRNLTDDATKVSAAEVIAQIEQAIVRSDQLTSIEESDDENLKALLIKARNNLRSQEVESISRNVIADRASAMVGASHEGDTQRALIQTQTTLQLFEPTGGVQTGFEADPLEMSAGDARQEIDDLIADLKSDDNRTRRDARSALIKHGSTAVAPMLEVYMRTEPKNQYRVGLGVAYVLYKMKQPVRLPDNKEAVDALLELLGDSQSDIRKYASEFLMKLYDRQSVDIVYEALRGVIRTERKNGNKLYNSVVVLGTWMRILPSPFFETRDSIRADLEELKESLQGNATAWQRTLNLIDEMLGIG